MKNLILKFGILSLVMFFGLTQISCQNSWKNESTKEVISQNMENEINKKFPKAKTEREWKAQLTAEQFEIMVKKGTEPPYKNAFFDNHVEGTYVSAATGEALFSSETKFDSGTGWPSFTKPLNDDAVIWVKDTSLGMLRDEVIEKSTGLHLGHVFVDGPAPTHIRYCINSTALKFVPKK